MKERRLTWFSTGFISACGLVALVIAVAMLTGMVGGDKEHKAYLHSMDSLDALRAKLYEPKPVDKDHDAVKYRMGAQDQTK